MLGDAAPRQTLQDALSCVAALLDSDAASDRQEPFIRFVVSTCEERGTGFAMQLVAILAARILETDHDAAELPRKPR